MCINDLITCGLKRSRIPSALIGAFDLTVLSIPLARGIQLYFELKSNPISTAWLISASMLYLLHLLCNLTNWYGLWRESSTLMLPKLVVKLFTVLCCTSFTIFIFFCLNQGSSWMVNNLMYYANLEYYAASAIISFGGPILVGASTVFTILQLWFLYILYEGYSMIREKELRKIVERRLDKISGAQANGNCNKVKPKVSVECLSKEHITLDDIDTVVVTHGHPGHMGNMNFFGQKPILYHTLEFIGRHVTPTELKERPYRKLSNNIEVWKTPGHTQHDLSVLVHNVQGYGSMAIVGDLIPTEQLVSDKYDAMAEEGVWDAAIKRQNANLIICMADWVIPGHGQPFRVLPQYRQKAGCTRLLAQRHILNTRTV